jgi:hypothetical protein
MIKFNTWKDDPSEVARRAWEWWGAHRKRFPSFALAVRLVVLVQTSTAAVERAFSQLKLIADLHVGVHD